MEKRENEKSSLIKQLWRRYTVSGSIDIWFLIIILALLCIGLVMLFSASYPYAMTYYSDSTYFIRRQLLFAGIGLACMILFSKIRPEVWQKLSFIVMGITVFCLLIVFVLPQYKAGFYRWINLGFTTFQPSEIAKFAVIVMGAFFYSKYALHMSSSRPASAGIAGKINKKLGIMLETWILTGIFGGIFILFAIIALAESYISGAILILALGVVVMVLSRVRPQWFIIRESWVPTWLFGGFFILCAVLVFAENHLSGAILIFAIGAVMMFLGGVRPRWFIVVGSAGIVLVALLCIYIMETRDSDSVNILQTYMRERIVAWLDKDYDPTGARWQTNQALYAIGSGGLFGKGLGNSTQKYMYVSEPQNDMIFSIVCEELGFVGASIVIILFALLVYRGVVIGMNSKTRFGCLLAMGLVFQVGLQVILNIAVATDSMPNTGISLPFFSYGGTSLVMLMSEMGIVLSVSREGRLSKH
ncbi:MAG: putative lipid II flippase FtsW [Clostridiales bacterium]|nr:putative lipid II flippase FtsW [Clostridiales bacterium]